MRNGFRNMFRINKQPSSKPLGVSIPVRGTCGSAGTAFQHQVNPIFRPSLTLHKALLAIAVACCTKPMRWFGAAFIWLQHISRESRVDLFKFVALFFCAPCFETSNFFFKCAYFLSLRRLRLFGVDGL